MAEEIDEVWLVNALLDIPLFERMEVHQIQRLIQVSQRLDPAPGTILCQAQSIDQSLLILLKGHLRLESEQGDRLGEMLPVRVIGEMGVFTGHPRSTRVVAEEPSALLEVGAESLAELLHAEPDIDHLLLLNLVKLLYARINDINADMGHLRDRAERLRERLAELAPDDPLLAGD